jgi:hypothetical protein
MSSNNNSGEQRSGPAIITSPSADTRTFNHRGTEVGSANVDLEQNTVNQNGPILTWTMPRKYTRVVFAGGKHFTKAELRTMETLTGTANDDSVVSLNTNIVPISGEEQLDEQPFPVVEAYNVTSDTEYDIVDVDYIANEVTLGTDPADGDDVKLWPVMSEGVVQYRGYDAFGHQVGPLDEWGVPAHVFADFDQEKNQTQIHMVGAAEFETDEELAMFLDAPRQLVWEDADYPYGEYVSTVEQRIDVEV